MLLEHGADASLKSEEGETPLDCCCDDEIEKVLSRATPKSKPAAKAPEPKKPAAKAPEPKKPAAKAPEPKEPASVPEDAEDVEPTSDKVQEPEPEASENTKKEEALLTAVKKGDLKAVKKAIKDGANPECRNKFGFTPLVLAALSGNVAIGTYLIEDANANVNAKNNVGMTALHVATVGDHAEFIRLLIGAGANSEQVNDNGETPADMATDDQCVSALRVRTFSTVKRTKGGTKPSKISNDEPEGTWMLKQGGGRKGVNFSGQKRRYGLGDVVRPAPTESYPCVWVGQVRVVFSDPHLTLCDGFVDTF